MTQTKRVVLDTNILIDNLDMLSENDNFVLPIKVIQELDGLKKDSNVGYAARAAIRSLIKFLHNDTKSFLFDSTIIPDVTNDQNIISSADRNDSKLYTKDLAMYLLAKSQEVDCEIVDDDFDNTEYDPFLFDRDPTFPFPTNDLEGDDLEDFKKYISAKFDKTLRPWMFYIIDKKQIFCFNPKKNVLENITNNPKYCNVLVDEKCDVVFKPKDVYQKAAIYSIMNSDATLMLGKFGTGKSLVSTAVSLTLAAGRKVFVIRPTIKSGRYDIGFLPGDKADKLYEFFSGYMSALSFLYGNTRTTNSGKGAGYDFVKEDLSKEKFEFLSMNELHGLSVQKGDIIIADEAQLFDRSYMQLLISRICEGAKLIIMGDLNQTYSLLHKSESGLFALLKQLPHPGLSMVELRKVYRNRELTDLAEKLVK